MIINSVCTCRQTAVSLQWHYQDMLEPDTVTAVTCCNEHSLVCLSTQSWKAELLKTWTVSHKCSSRAYLCYVTQGVGNRGIAPRPYCCICLNFQVLNADLDCCKLHANPGHQSVLSFVINPVILVIISLKSLHNTS